MVIYSGNYVYGSTDELYHYGVLGMRWGVHKARYYKKQANKYRTMYDQTGEARAKAKNYERLLEETKKNIVSKSTEKLKGINKKYQKRQDAADRNYDKGDRRDHSWLASEESVERAYRKASRQQYKANRLATRGKRWYKQMVRAYGDLELTMDPELVEIGRELVNHVTTQSQVKYAQKVHKKKR